jgi:hypothetical protein
LADIVKAGMVMAEVVMLKIRPQGAPYTGATTKQLHE